MISQSVGVGQPTEVATTSEPDRLMSILNETGTLVEVATTGEPARWMSILEEIGTYDLYHLPAYQRLSEMRIGGQAVLPVFRSKGYAMAFPMLLRDVVVPGSISTGYRDAACVPGLTGPVIPKETPPEDVRHGLMQQFQDYLKQNRIVAVYSRLHCLLEQEAFLSGYGETLDEGVEVAIDLTVPPEELYSRYRKDHRECLKKLRRNGFVFEEVGPEYLDEFVRMYNATMDRVGARALHYTDSSHFDYLMSEMSECSHLFACKDGDVVACFGLVMVCRGHIHAYRAGMAEEYRKFAVSKLMYDGVRIWGQSIGAQVFLVGGGVDAKRDSLYDFKMGFGGREHVYSTWRYVADREVYADLCRCAFDVAGRPPQDTYFPEYRSPSLSQSQEARGS